MCVREGEPEEDERQRVERERERKGEGGKKKKNGEARSGKVDNHAFNKETKARASTFHGREERRERKKGRIVANKYFESSRRGARLIAPFYRQTNVPSTGREKAKAR